MTVGLTKILLAFTVMIIQTTATAGAFDDLVKKQKVGMWQITRSGNAFNFDASGNPMNSQETNYFCLDEKNRAEAREASGTAISLDNCQIHSEKVENSKFNLVMVCGRNTADAVTITETGTFKEDSFRIESVITMPPHIRAAKTMTETTEGKLVRPCRKNEPPGIQDEKPEDQ